MNANRKNETKKLVFSALIAALVFVATAFIQIPMGFGYVHAGDALVVLAATLLSPWYGFFAAAIGSCMADIFLSYVAYAPITFLIKGGMVLVICGMLKLWKGEKKPLWAQILAVVAAELLMVLGYFVFEGFLYGFVAAAPAIAFNAGQGAVGATLGLILTRILKQKRFAEFWDTFQK